MPRAPRKISNTGIYHVVLRGINKQTIFEDEEDYLKFLEILQIYKQKCEFQLYAYCLMSNHIHLLIRTEKDEIGQVFRRIETCFVNWYNNKYDRVGHLFQNRYRSEPVENTGYFLKVLRYIHYNPIKAGLCKKPEDYPYSSYRCYFSSSQLIDSKFTYKIISSKDFISFHLIPNEDVCLEGEPGKSRLLTDEQARELMKKIANCSDVSEFQCLDKANRKAAVREMLRRRVSVKQASRITGLSINTVKKYREIDPGDVSGGQF